MKQKLTPEIISAAIAGFEAQKSQIDSQISDLRSMLNGQRIGPAVTHAETGNGKRRFSLASRRKMAAAQKARWAKIKQSSEPTKVVTAKPKRKMSASARRRIAAAQKKRWAIKKAAAKKAA